MGKYTLILPFRNEFGTFISYFVRWVYLLDDKEKLVCIKKGQEILFPNATKFYYDWDDTHDFWKRGLKTFRSKNHKKYMSKLAGDIKEIYDIDKVLNPICPKKQPIFSNCDISIPIQNNFGISCDIVLAPRYRRYADGRNYPREYWQVISDYFRSKGYVVGCVGLRGFSYDIGCDVRSWDYPGGLISDIELLQSAKIVITLDSGMAHLAVLCGCPLKIIYGDRGVLPGSTGIRWMFDIHSGYAINHCEPIIGGWDNFNIVIAEVNNYLENLS